MLQKIKRSKMDKNVKQIVGDTRKIFDVRIL